MAHHTTHTLIRHGTLIDTEPTPHVLAQTADLLITAGRIRAIDTSGQGDLLRADEPGTVQEVDATGMIVLPGFVDTHRHTWQTALRAVLPDSTLAGYMARVIGEMAPRYQPQDVADGNLAGALECLNAGITTLLDWSHIQRSPDHTEAAIRGLTDAGIRAVFGYAYDIDGDTQRLASEVRRVRHAHFSRDHDLLSMALAALGPDFGPEERMLAEWRVADELDLPITVHTGVAGPELATAGLELLIRHRLLRPTTTYVHAASYSDDQLRLLADSGARVSVSPVSELVLNFGPPPTGRALAAGLRTSLGVDTVASGAGDMFSQMRAAYQTERARPDGAGLGFSVADALRLATIGGAEVLGLTERIGSLRPGKAADLVLLRTDTPGMAGLRDPIAATVLAADVSAVDTVLVEGRLMKRDGQLVGHDHGELARRLTAQGERLRSGS